MVKKIKYCKSVKKKLRIKNIKNRSSVSLSIDSSKLIELPVLTNLFS